MRTGGNILVLHQCWMRSKFTHPEKTLFNLLNDRSGMNVPFCSYAPTAFCGNCRWE